MLKLLQAGKALPKWMTTFGPHVCLPQIWLLSSSGQERWNAFLKLIDLSKQIFVSVSGLLLQGTYNLYLFFLALLLCWNDVFCTHLQNPPFNQWHCFLPSSLSAALFFNIFPITFLFLKIPQSSVFSLKLCRRLITGFLFLILLNPISHWDSSAAVENYFLLLTQIFYSSSTFLPYYHPRCHPGSSLGDHFYLLQMQRTIQVKQGT